MAKNPKWTPEEDKALKRLHASGLKARETAQRLHALGHPERTRDAVLGRLQRLGMSVADLRRAPDRSKGTPADHAALAKLCQWPDGDPGHPDFKFCHAPTKPGKPYCAEHHARSTGGTVNLARLVG